MNEADRTLASLLERVKAERTKFLRMRRFRWNHNTGSIRGERQFQRTSDEVDRRAVDRPERFRVRILCTAPKLRKRYPYKGCRFLGPSFVGTDSELARDPRVLFRRMTRARQTSTIAKSTYKVHDNGTVPTFQARASRMSIVLRSKASVASRRTHCWLGTERLRCAASPFGISKHRGETSEQA